MQKYNESIMVNEIGKNDFFKLMKENDVDFDEVVQKQKSSNEHFHKFNYVVRKSVKEGKFTLIDVFNYINSDVYAYKDSLECFNEANKFYLRREMAEKYGIKIRKNIMSKFVTKRKRKS